MAHVPTTAAEWKLALRATAAIPLHAVAPLADAGARGLTTDVARVRRAAELGYAAMAADLERAQTEAPTCW